MCEESGLLPLQCECVSILASAYEAAGKLKESITYFNKFITLNAEVHNEQKQRALVEISARVEIEKADRERARMEQLAKDADGRAELLRYETKRQSKQLTTLALQLVQKNEFLCNLREEIEPAIKSPRKAKKITEQIDAHIKSDRDWETFEHQFDQVHRDFVNKLASTYPVLTPAEIKIGVLVKLNLSTKAMASLLCLSTRTVENHRMSLRRKVGLGAEDNLVSFLTGFGGTE
jgi:DNA-binding CsgD family transcriptional regulator